MPLPRINMESDTCCEPCIDPCATCHEGDCVEVAIMFQFREVHDWKCGFPLLTADDWDIVDPTDFRRWRSITIHWTNHQEVEITGPLTPPCSDHLGTFYEADSDVSVTWTIHDPPYLGDTRCLGTMTLEAGASVTDTNGSSTPAIDDPDAEPFYPEAGFVSPPLSYTGPAENQWGDCCEETCGGWSEAGGGTATHREFSRTNTNTFGPPGTDGCDLGVPFGHNCNCTCDSTDTIEYTLADEFATADLVSNVQDEMDAETPGGTAFGEAYAWLGIDPNNTGAGELYCGARWVTYSFNVIPPPGQTVLVEWDEVTYPADEEGHIGGPASGTTPRSEVDPNGTVTYDMNPTIGGTNVVMRIENIVTTCTDIP